MGVLGLSRVIGGSLVFLWMYWVLVVVLGLEPSTKQTMWARQQDVIASEPVVFPDCRSMLDCAVQCQGFSHCAAFTFDPTIGTCSLFPVQTSQSAAAVQQTLPLFWNTNPVCEEVVIGNGTTSWQSALTSLEGNVTCKENFMYSSNVTTFRCLSNGVWEPPIGQCLQYYWRNTRGDFPLPRPIFPGWGVCVAGTPTLKTKFRGGTLNTSMNSVLHCSFLLNSSGKTDTIMINMDKVAGGGVTANAHSFPFTVGQAFNMSMRIINSDHTYSLTINGLEYIQRQSAQPLSEIVATYFDGDVDVDYVNVWCV